MNRFFLWLTPFIPFTVQFYDFCQKRKKNWEKRKINKENGKKVALSIFRYAKIFKQAIDKIDNYWEKKYYKKKKRKEKYFVFRLQSSTNHQLNTVNIVILNKWKGRKEIMPRIWRRSLIIEIYSLATTMVRCLVIIFG